MVNLVSFPALGLEFTLNRVVFELFGRPIYWYGLIIACGFMMGTMIAARYAVKAGLEEDHVYDFLLYGVPAALVGLRTYFVVFYLDLFKNPDGSLDWPAIFRISDGGMAIYGGIIAGMIVLVYYAKKKGINYFALADVISMGVIFGQFVGRWGNFMNVEAYGGLTVGPWRMCSESIAEEMFAKGYANSEQYWEIIQGTLGVHPTFFYESMWNLLGFFFLLRVFRDYRRFEGQMICSYFAWYGFGRFLIEGMRTDSLYFFGLEFMGYPLRTSQMLSLGLCVGALLLLQLGKKGKISAFVPLNNVEQLADKQSDNSFELLVEELSEVVSSTLDDTKENEATTDVEAKETSDVEVKETSDVEAKETTDVEAKETSDVEATAEVEEKTEI